MLMVSIERRGVYEMKFLWYCEREFKYCNTILFCYSALLMKYFSLNVLLT